MAKPAPDNLWLAVADGFAFSGVEHPRITAELRRLERYPRHVPNLAERAAPFLPEIVLKLERRGLPLDLALLPALESGYRPEATSPRGAAGLWQFMPATARHVGLRVDATVDDRRSFARSTAAALDHLEALHRRFDGDWLKAVAAYNCGESRLKRALAKARIRQPHRPPELWDLRLPRETMRYVPRWLALVKTFESRADTLPALTPEPELEEIPISPPIDFALAVELARIAPEEFARYNARYRPEVLLPVVDSVWLPQPAKAAFTDRLAALTPAQRSRRTRYRVRRGDSLWRIASRHAVSVDYLRRINRIDLDAVLMPGQILKLVEFE